MSLKTASVLAFERKLDPSDALMYGGNWDDRASDAAWQVIPVREKAVRGTISNRLKTKDQDPAKLDAAIQNPNLQTVDVAALSSETDTLKVSFTLRVLGGAGRPSACNNLDYQTKLLQTVDSYVASNGFGELARRYAHNLACGRFLWRNRMRAEQIDVRITWVERGADVQSWTFDALALSLRHFDPGPAQTELSTLTDVFVQGLSGQRPVLFRIDAYARVGAGQEVFPSQDLVLERGRGTKSKTLYHLNQGAAIHSQKLGNAIRAIDDWYDGAEALGPIAVEPYGAVTTQGKAFRPPKKNDFYNLLDDWLLKDKVPPVEQQHFVMAVLIRGGVFGDAGN